MPMYEYECQVEGHYSGTVEAKNKTEALEMAKNDVECEGLTVVDEIDLHRLSKEEY